MGSDFLIMIVTMMGAHLVADTFLQSREEAKKKSEDKKVLFKHVKTNFFVTAGFLFIVYTIQTMITTYTYGLDTVFVIIASFLNSFGALVQAFWNAAIHALIDWNIWRLYKKKVVGNNENFKKYLRKNTDHSEEHIQAMGKADLQNFRFWEDPWFFHTIMIDQFLHYLTIVLLAYLATISF